MTKQKYSRSILHLDIRNLFVNSNFVIRYFKFSPSTRALVNR